MRGALTIVKFTVVRRYLTQREIGQRLIARSMVLVGPRACAVATFVRRRFGTAPGGARWWSSQASSRS